MKKVLFVAVILLTHLLCFGQNLPKIEATPQGLSAIVVDVENMSAQQLYDLSVKWVNKYFAEPKEVIKSDIENESLRISGYHTNAFWFKMMGAKNDFNSTYQIDLEFKDNKYRCTFTIGDFYTKNDEPTAFNFNSFFKNDGSVKKAYIDAQKSLEQTINGISQSYYDYVTGKEKSSSDDW